MQRRSAAGPARRERKSPRILARLSECGARQRSDEGCETALQGTSLCRRRSSEMATAKVQGGRREPARAALKGEKGVSTFLTAGTRHSACVVVRMSNQARCALRAGDSMRQRSLIMGSRHASGSRRTTSVDTSRARPGRLPVCSRKMHNVKVHPQTLRLFHLEGWCASNPIQTIGTSSRASRLAPARKKRSSPPTCPSSSPACPRRGWSRRRGARGASGAATRGWRRSSSGAGGAAGATSWRATSRRSRRTG